jgi:hypothetical protein
VRDQSLELFFLISGHKGSAREARERATKYTLSPQNNILQNIITIVKKKGQGGVRCLQLQTINFLNQNDITDQNNH